MDKSLVFQFILIPFELCLYLGVGTLICRVFIREKTWPIHVLVGFFATPLLTGVAGYLLGCALHWALTSVLLGLCILQGIVKFIPRIRSEESLKWPSIPPVILLIAILFSMAVSTVNSSAAE